ncbi:MAG: hypothetical protein DMF62_00380 [Acidobacteria bacterium]|nr:MAG: hypothetical protein DMF62_00380 [Acidobacteriota bacterium]
MIQPEEKRGDIVMTKKLVLITLMIGCVIGIAFHLRPSPLDQIAYRNALHTDAVHVFGEPRFIGCPNVMHRVQGPWTVAVEATWSDSLEPIRNALDPHSFQREHYAAIDWHGNFEKPLPRVCQNWHGWRVQVDALGNDMTKNPYMKVAVSETNKNLLVTSRHIDTISVVEAMAARYDLRSELPKRENEPRLGSRPVN